MATKTQEHPLAHLIPEDVDYIGRRIHGYEDTDVLKFAQGQGENVLIYGPPGPGKTTFIRHYAEMTNQPLVTILADGGMDTASFTGYREATGGDVSFVKADPITLIENGNGILYIDEIVAMPRSFTTAFHSLLDDRRSITIPKLGYEEITAGPNLLIVASYNPDAEGTRPLPAALMDRFHYCIEWDYDYAIEAQLVPLPAVLELAKQIRARKQEFRRQLSTRMLQAFLNDSLSFSVEFAIGNFVGKYPKHEQDAIRQLMDLQSARIAEEVATLVADDDEG